MVLSGRRRGVPFFVKGSVKKKFPREADKWVLLDWKGKFAKAYATKKDVCTIMLLDQEGVVRYRRSVTELDSEIVHKFAAEVKKLLTAELE
ncbi:MAG: hypothetical protein OEN01_11970 [Candidatus Krumholzibacteria bacterium]|nr:hypothetical protein [Candidatus Krumholzibacteria bacterium]